MATIEIDLNDIDTKCLIEELQERFEYEDQDLVPFILTNTPSLVDKEKIEYFLQNREKISMEALEKLIESS